mmetsp:Transcript_7626/g.19456  ORF Transcript_7626/g.19456 Transcript_7626/m.19456 type:complete len:216 (+) Transcript_7626:80-727(+)
MITKPRFATIVTFSLDRGITWLSLKAQNRNGSGSGTEMFAETETKRRSVCSGVLIAALTWPMTRNATALPRATGSNRVSANANRGGAECRAWIDLSSSARNGGGTPSRCKSACTSLLVRITRSAPEMWYRRKEFVKYAPSASANCSWTQRTMSRGVQSFGGPSAGRAAGGRDWAARRTSSASSRIDRSMASARARGAALLHLLWAALAIGGSSLA